MKKRVYEALGETGYFDTLPNGLSVAVVKRPGFSKRLAYFVTDYGSIHTHFTLDGKPYIAPDGVAHFLEHKLFDMPGRDITAEFAGLGAVPNAFTGYDMTAYYFSCTENFYESLSLLLEFVSTPCFTKESVDKEQGIIGQEIDMNVDAPETRVFENLMQAMYENHPIRVPILGDRDSIGKITPQILTDCHRAYYRPGNMLLCVVGDVDPQEVCRLARKQLGDTPAPAVERVNRWQEDMTCRQHIIHDTMEVSMPMFQIGFKSRALGMGPEAVMQELIGDLAAEALFGESSRLYMQLYEQGLIDTSFGGGYDTVDGLSMLTCSGDSNDPEGVRDAVLAQVHKLLETGISQEDFLRMKRSAMGRRIKDLDSFDATAFRICAYHFSGFDYFDFPSIYQQIGAHQLLEFLQQTVTEARCCLSVVYPIEQEDESLCNG